MKKSYNTHYFEDSQSKYMYAHTHIPRILLVIFTILIFVLHTIFCPFPNSCPSTIMSCTQPDQWNVSRAQLMAVCNSSSWWWILVVKMRTNLIRSKLYLKTVWLQPAPMYKLSHRFHTYIYFKQWFALRSVLIKR